MKPTASLTVPAILWPAMTFEEWRAQAPKLGQLARGIQWHIADWIEWGEARYGERYAQAVAETGLAEQTLLNILSVARKFPAARRRASLDFSIHAAVAALEPAAQDTYLDAAEKGSWSVTRLRAEVRVSGGRPKPRQVVADPVVLEPAAGSTRVIVGTLLDIEGAGLCKVTSIFEHDAESPKAGVVIKCVRLS